MKGHRLPFLIFSTMALLLFVFIAMSFHLSFLRISFPYDYYMWADSTFMTNILKLINGESVHSEAWRANSFPYPPGFEYLYYGLIKLLDLTPHIFVPRCMSLLFTVAASGVFARISTFCLDGTENKNSYLLFSFAIIFLIVNDSMLADIPHPDSALLLFISLLTYLTMKAVKQKSFLLAVFSIGIASMGVWIKQTAVLAPAAVGLCVWFFSNFSRRQKYLILSPGIMFGAISYGIYAADHWRFYTTISLLASQQIHLKKVLMFFPFLINSHGIYSSFLLLGIFTSTALWLKGKLPKPPKSWYAAATMLILCSAPALAGFFKVNGSYNNIIVGFDVPSSIILLSLLFLYLDRSKTPIWKLFQNISLATKIGIILFLLLLVPNKKIPSKKMLEEAHLTHNDIVTEMLSGKKVYVSASILLGYPHSLKTVPVDRSYSVFELNQAKSMYLNAAKKRFLHKDYDVIYYERGKFLNLEFRNIIKAGYCNARESFFNDKNSIMPLRIAYFRKILFWGYRILDKHFSGERYMLKYYERRILGGFDKSNSHWVKLSRCSKDSSYDG